MNPLGAIGIPGDLDHEKGPSADGPLSCSCLGELKTSFGHFILLSVLRDLSDQEFADDVDEQHSSSGERFGSTIGQPV